MNNIRILLSALLMFVTLSFFACEKKNDKKDMEDHNSGNQTVDRSMDKKNIIGIWKFVERNNWVELKEDGTYDSGKDGELMKSGNTWEIDTEKGILKLNDPEKPWEMNYKLSGDELIINRKGKKRTITAVRIDKRPDHQ